MGSSSAASRYLIAATDSRREDRTSWRRRDECPWIRGTAWIQIDNRLVPLQVRLSDQIDDVVLLALACQRKRLPVVSGCPLVIRLRAVCLPEICSALERGLPAVGLQQVGQRLLRLLHDQVSPPQQQARPEHSRLHLKALLKCLHCILVPSLQVVGKAEVLINPGTAYGYRSRMSSYSSPARSYRCEASNLLAARKCPSMKDLSDWLKPEVCARTPPASQFAATSAASAASRRAPVHRAGVDLRNLTDLVLRTAYHPNPVISKERVTHHSFARHVAGSAIVCSHRTTAPLVGTFPRMARQTRTVVTFLLRPGVRVRSHDMWCI